MTTGRVAAAHVDGSMAFARWRQCAAHLKWFLGPTRVQIPNDSSIGSIVLHSSRQSRYALQQAALPP